MFALVGTATAGVVGVAAALATPVLAEGLQLHAPKFPWSHNGLLNALDAARYECLLKCFHSAFLSLIDIVALVY